MWIYMPGLSKPVGTGPVWTGPARLRFGPVSNRPEFKIQIWIQKNKNSQTGHTGRFTGQTGR